MGDIYLRKPQFLTKEKNPPLHKLMFVKRGGKAIHALGDLTRHQLSVELICVTDEDKDNWIGNYAEGIGFYKIKFNKKDCRDASEKEIEDWISGKEIVF